MKKIIFTVVLVFVMGAFVQGCGAKDESKEASEIPETAESGESKGEITEDMAYEAVSNYCHKEYDWSAAEDPSMMYIEMGEGSESEYKVVFHSYTGALVNFYVNKETGDTRLTEYVPALNIEEEAGNINIRDYL